MSKLIYCKFLDYNGNPRGRNYTYKTDVPVSVGDMVSVSVTRNDSSEVSTVNKKVIVTATDLEPSDIPGYENFADVVKTINGLWEDETESKGV